MRIVKDRGGVALIGALWALLLLTSLGTTVAVAARQQVWVAGGHEGRVAARWAAEAGVVLAEARLEEALRAGHVEFASAGGDTATLAQRRSTLRVLNALGEDFIGSEPLTLPSGARATVEVRDLSARLNLNAAGERELHTFFRQWIIDERALSILVHSFLDWRDEDELVRAQGAEAEFYARLPQPYTPRNGPLLSVRELLLVRGMTPELYRRVEPYLAALPTDRLRVNVNAAPAEVLTAVPGFSPELARRLAERRVAAGPLLSSSELAADPELRPFFVAAEGAQAINVIALQPEVMEVRSHGTSGEARARHRVEALYAIDGLRLRRLERREAGL